MTLTDTALEQRARRAAKRIGLAATKSRGRLNLDNCGGFMIFDLYNNHIEAGARFDLTAEQVIEFCEDRAA